MLPFRSGEGSSRLVRVSLGLFASSLVHVSSERLSSVCVGKMSFLPTLGLFLASRPSVSPGSCRRWFCLNSNSSTDLQVCLSLVLVRVAWATDVFWIPWSSLLLRFPAFQDSDIGPEAAS